MATERRLRGAGPLAEPFRIGGHSVDPGTRRYLDLPLPPAFGHAQLAMPAVVCHGRRPGPAVLVSAAIHGDEIIGTEIIRRLLARLHRRRLRGTVVAVPVVNAYGFISQSRYLPDLRDLNRSFPGSPSGSLAARLAHLFLETVVSPCDLAIDLHSAAKHRDNLPQIRADLADSRVKNLAEAFAVPVLLDSAIRDGSLREAVRAQGKPCLLYEAGEALRFDETAIRAGVRGCLNVLGRTGVLPEPPPPRKVAVVAAGTRWVRTPASGLLRPAVALGDAIAPGALLATIAEPTGREEVEVRAEDHGIVIGRTNLPLVNAGDGVLHLGLFPSPGQARAVAQAIDDYEQEIDPPPVEEEGPVP